MRSFILIFVTMTMLLTVHVSTAAADQAHEKLGRFLGKGVALNMFFWNLGKLTYKMKIFAGEEKIIEAPLSAFLGEVIADTGKYSYDMPFNYTSSFFQDGGCQEILNTPKLSKGNEFRCLVWIDKNNEGGGITRYNIAFKMTQLENPKNNPFQNFSIENASIVRSVQQQDKDGSMKEAKILE